MRISELIIRLIDWFYRKPVAAILPRQTFRYIVCGGANVVFSWVCYFLVYNFVLECGNRYAEGFRCTLFR